ncbi:oxidoreductase-like protein [Biscogniauxia marginata]|nr:oxidoreductase-like protein [Biscogniauxia marginata]
MPLNARPFLRAARLKSIARRSQTTPRACLSTGGKLPGGTPGEASEQAAPIGPYYEAILIKPQPVPDVKPEDPPTSSPKSPRTTVKKPPPPGKKPQNPAADKPAAASLPSSSSSPTTSAAPASAQEKARIIFGSRLAGPAERAERLNAIRKRSTLIAGVLVPPRPDEPDNCCMSGCVNCVWDRYRDEVEEWAAASATAEKALQAQRSRGPAGVGAAKGPAPDVRRAGATSMEADLKKADRPKIAKDLWDDDLYKNVPVGIREFMKQEKKLKEKHDREGTFGA